MTIRAVFKVEIEFVESEQGSNYQSFKLLEDHIGLRYSVLESCLSYDVSSPSEGANGSLIVEFIDLQLAIEADNNIMEVLKEIGYTVVVEEED